MSTTIYASFVDIDQGEKAAGALLDHGVQKEDISLVANTDNRRFQEQEVGVATLEYNENPDYLQNVDYGTSQVFAPVGFYPEGILPQTPVVYPIVSPENVSASDDYITNTNEGNANIDATGADSVAKSGITTTTAKDAEVAAIAGTEVGLGLGILAGIAALIVPGVGLVLGGGALAGAIAMAVSTTVAGAAVGGVIGYLKDQGVNESDALAYDRVVGAGGALIAINLPSNGVDLREAELVLNKYGASDIKTY